MRLSLTIPGRIGGKGRPRFSSRGGFVRTFTPEKTRNTEAMMRDMASQAMKGKPIFEGPLALTIRVVITPPQSWSKKKRASAIFVTGKPDCDNTIKLIDAFNGIIWRDDSQISTIAFSRRYSLTESESVQFVVQHEIDERGAMSPLRLLVKIA